RRAYRLLTMFSPAPSARATVRMMKPAQTFCVTVIAACGKPGTALTPPVMISVGTTLDSRQTRPKSSMAPVFIRESRPRTRMRLTSQLATQASSSRPAQAARVCSSGWPRSQSRLEASSSCMSVSRKTADSGPVGADENRGVDAHVVQADVPVQVRAGGTPGAAHLAQHLAALQALPHRDIDGREVAEHADQPPAVIDEHRLAVE